MSTRTKEYRKGPTISTRKKKLKKIVKKGFDVTDVVKAIGEGEHTKHYNWNYDYSDEVGGAKKRAKDEGYTKADRHIPSKFYKQEREARAAKVKAETENITKIAKKALLKKKKKK